MTVNITWSLSDGGTDISEPLDHGSSAPGTTIEEDIYFSHDGDNPITNCKFYLAEYSGTYTGSDSAPNDLATLLNFGANSTSSTFGGFMINMDAVGVFASSWPTYDSKNQSYSAVFRNGSDAYGDSLTRGVVLSSRVSSGMSSDGNIPALCSPTPHIKIRIVIPSSGALSGTIQFDQVFSFTYTS